MSYSFLEKVLIRTPLKPSCNIFSEEEIKTLVSDPSIKEAIFLASPDLYSKLNKWIEGKIEDKKEQLKIRDSLLKYLLRAHNRSTPFGLFASCGLSNWSTNYLLKKRSRNSRLDMNYSCVLADELSKIDFIKKKIRFYTNNTLYKIGNSFRYVEYYYSNNQRKYQLSEVEVSDFLEKVLNLANQGSTIIQLTEALASNEFDINEVESFLNELIEAQLIISELEPSVCRGELLLQIINTLSKIEKKNSDKRIKDIINSLRDIKNLLINLDENLTNNIENYEKIINKLKDFGIKIEENKLFQIDLFSEFSASNKDTTAVNTIQSNLIKTISILNRLMPKTQKTFFDEFKEKFYNRYEFREVALLEALDTEDGIGYANHSDGFGDINPFLDNINFISKKNENINVQWTKTQSLLFKKIIDAKAFGTKKIIITENEVSSWSCDDEPHDTFTVFFKIFKQANENHKIYLNYAGNSSAAFLLGRFADNNHEIFSLVKRIAEIEQKEESNKLIAEIAHLPDNRLGNVTVRPSFRKYEIPYISNPLNSSSHQILTNDLLLSIRNDKLVLRSKSLNKEIIPKLTNAHNYSFNSLPVYHFLCDFQNNDKKPIIKFDWGIIKHEVTFLPRVEVENIIVSLATWQLSSKMLEPLHKISECNESTLLIVNEWQKTYNIPDLVLLVEGDNELIINLKNHISVNMFISYTKKIAKDKIIITEYIYESQDLILDSDNKSYSSELIGFLKKETNNNSNEISISQPSSYIVKRKFHIGSEWLYFKLYCGIKTADKFLITTIKEFVKKYTENNFIDKWFYIRYSDPEPHIRLRINVSNKNLIGVLISELNLAIKNSEYANSIWKIQTDTYVREVERYGKSTIRLVEKYFHLDSCATLDLIEYVEDNENLRIISAMKSIDYLLSDFKLSYPMKLDFLNELRKEFSNRYDLDYLKAQLNNKFRNIKGNVEKALKEEDNDLDLLKIKSILKKRTDQSLEIINNIYKQLNIENEISVYNLLGSIVHMLINRILRSKHNMNEAVIYDIMWRLYRSKIAQSQNEFKQIIK